VQAEPQHVVGLVGDVDEFLQAQRLDSSGPIIFRKYENFCGQIGLIDTVAKGLLCYGSPISQPLELFGGKFVPHRFGKRVAD
jgi:hypothetical protein